MLFFDMTCAFNAVVRKMTDKNAEFQKACMESPRRHVVLENLCSQVAKFERKFGNRAQKKHRDLLVETVADMFVKSVWVEYAKMYNNMPKINKTEYQKFMEKGEAAKELLSDMGIIQKQTHKEIEK